jgi:hypothetical protein
VQHQNGIVVVARWLVPFAAWTQTATAHHTFVEYDMRRTVEVTGTLVEIVWANPHVHLSVQSIPDEQGKIVVWDIEGHSLSVLRRTSVTADQFKRGDKIKVAGDPSRRAANRMFATNVLRADGVELLMAPGAKRRWEDAPLRFTTSWFDAGDSSSKEAGIFKVWSSKLDDPGELWKRNYPMTEKGKSLHSGWNRQRDTVARGCEPKGMPTIMEQPYPIEFVRDGNRILLRMEEYDTVRTIIMESNAPAAAPTSRLGVSTGSWDKSALVVTTDRIDWPYLDANGVPLGSAARIVERFAPSADGSRLAYTMTITSPEIFTEPVELTRSWVWRPNEKVQPYRCESL